MSPKRAGPVGLLSSTFEEAEGFIKRITNRTKKAHDNLLFVCGNLSERKVVLVLSGIGKTNAAHAASVLIRNYSPSFVVNFGIGGAYPGLGLKPGDMAVATTEIYADEGVLLREGFRSLEIIGIPLLKAGGREFFNAFPLDSVLSEAALSSSKRHADSATGPFATVSTCSGTKERARYLAGKFGTVCENMEGAAVAHVCLMYGIRCAEIRGISNIVEDRDTSKWTIKPAAETCHKVLLDFLSQTSDSI